MTVLDNVLKTKDLQQRDCSGFSPDSLSIHVPCQLRRAVHGMHIFGTKPMQRYELFCTYTCFFPIFYAYINIIRCSGGGRCVARLSLIAARAVYGCRKMRISFRGREDILTGLRRYPRGAARISSPNCNFTASLHHKSTNNSEYVWRCHFFFVLLPHN